MKIIKAGYEIMPNFENPLKKIELVARTCYKSEDLITEDSCVKMVENLVSRGHLAMLEHASLAYIVDHATFELVANIVNNIEINVFEGEERYPVKSFVRFTAHHVEVEGEDDSLVDRFIISGNLRAYAEMFQLLLDAVSFLPEQLVTAVAEDSNGAVDYRPCLAGGEMGRAGITLITDFSKLSLSERVVHETLTVKFTVDRGVTHEFVRHRPASFAQESTRYCNYSKGKFGNEITVIEPCFYAGRNDEYNAWVSAMEDAEKHYFDLLNAGSTPQEARSVLPTSTKADLIITATVEEWLHILDLRALGVTGKPHPQMLEVMVPLAKELASNQLKDYDKFTTIKQILEME